jgi:hypothetical protein
MQQWYLILAVCGELDAVVWYKLMYITVLVAL